MGKIKLEIFDSLSRNKSMGLEGSTGRRHIVCYHAFVKIHKIRVIMSSCLAWKIMRTARSVETFPSLREPFSPFLSFPRIDIFREAASIYSRLFIPSTFYLSPRRVYFIHLDKYRRKLHLSREREIKSRTYGIIVVRLDRYEIWIVARQVE